MMVVPRRAGCTGLQRGMRNGAWSSRHERRSFVTGVLRVKYVFLLGYSFLVSVPALGQVIAGTDDLAARDGDITVVATGAEIQLSDTGQSISIIDAAEIAAIQGPDITRVLERLPGVTISRNGGLGNFTGVRVRGADAEQLLVLIDGVRVGDVASPAGGFDFGNLAPGSIGKIELLRGSNSVVWGSQAIGGVLAVSSREFNGIEASAEYGAHDSFAAGAVAGFAGARGSVTLNGGYTSSEGISAAAAGSEPDGYRQWRVGGRGRLMLSEALSATLTGRYADSRVDFDSYLFVDDPEFQKTREASGRAGLAYDSAGLHLDGGLAVSDTRRAYFDPTFGSDSGFDTRGRSERIDLTGRVALPQDFTVTFGADSEWTRFATTFDPERKARLSSGHALLGWHQDGLDLSAGVRIDDHSRFGREWTFGANGSLRIAADWRVRASYGEGFKAPTLVQLYGFGGNTALSPERSKAYDIAVEKGDRNAGFHAALTGFRRDTRDLIVFTLPFGPNYNVGRARAEGFEAELGAAITGRLRAQAAYSYVKAVNRTLGDANSGNDLARRPRHALTVSADWNTPLHGLSLGADLRFVGDSFDNAANNVGLDEYAVATLRAGLPLTDRFELFGRVENVTDETYQTAAGYGTPGRSAYAGVRARF